MVDDDEVAFLPAMVLAVVRGDTHETVTVALDHVEPRFTRVAMKRLGLAGCELNHDLSQPGCLIADGTVVQKLRAGATWRGENLLLVVGRMDAPGASLLRLLIDAAQPPGVRVVARDARRHLWMRRQL